MTALMTGFVPSMMEVNRSRAPARVKVCEIRSRTGTRPVRIRSSDIRKLMAGSAK